MRWPAGFAFILIASFHSIYAQVDDRIPPQSEERAVQVLVARFFKDYEKELRLAPLIKKYFVTDISERLEYCGTTGNCGGFGRDFWQKNDDLVELRARRSDYLEEYSTNIDGWYLYFRSLHYLATSRGMNLADGSNEEELDKVFQKELQTRFGKNSKMLKLNFLGTEESTLRPKSLTEYRKNRSAREVFISELRKILKKYRYLADRKFPPARYSAKLKDFEIYKEKNKNKFFKYENDVFVYEAWPKGYTEIPLKMDLIRENGKLKIVAVYPPMD